MNGPEILPCSLPPNQSWVRMYRLPVICIFEPNYGSLHIETLPNFRATQLGNILDNFCYSFRNKHIPTFWGPNIIYSNLQPFPRLIVITSGTGWSPRNPTPPGKRHSDTFRSFCFSAPLKSPSYKCRVIPATIKNKILESADMLVHFFELCNAPLMFRLTRIFL